MPTEALAQTIVLPEWLTRKRADILALAAKHGAANVRLFGSVVRGDARPDSDVDFLVDMAPDRSLLDRIGLIQDLQDILGRKADVVTETTLHWFIRKAVLKQAMPL